MNKLEYCKSIHWEIIKGGAFADNIDNLLFVWRQTRTSINDNTSAKIVGKSIHDQMLLAFPGEVPLVFNHGKNRFSESGQPPPSGAFITTKVKFYQIIIIAF